MVKDKKFLENIAQFCLDRAKKLGQLTVSWA